jgi:hypothetical protein
MTDLLKRIFKSALILVTLLFFMDSFNSSHAQENRTSGTTRFVFDGNRMYAELAFVKPDGSLRLALAFVDLGSPSTVLSASLFKELQIDRKRPLAFRVREMTVHVDAADVSSEEDWFPIPVGDDLPVEALLPAGVMQNYLVVMDYQRRTLTLAQPGTLKPEGAAAPFHVNKKTGLLAVDATIDGRSYPITIDNGSAYTWLRKSTVEEWLRVHPEWRRGEGAVGASNMRMADDGIETAGTLIRIPEIKLGALSLRQIGALGIGPNDKGVDLIDWYSQKNYGPVLGFLGGNALQGFQLTIDYPNKMIYWLKQTELDPHDLDQVGLTLKFKDNTYYVAAITTQNGKPTVEGVRVGDKLLRVGEQKLEGATWGTIFTALHGKPGESRTLVLERDGAQVTIRAKVTRF